MRAFAFAVLTVLFAGTGSAQEHGEYYDFVRKVRVNPAPDDYLYIAVNGNFSSQHGCQDVSWARSKQKISSEITKAHLQLAMGSFLSRGKVYVETSGCDTATGNNRIYPIFDALQIDQ